MKREKLTPLTEMNLGHHADHLVMRPDKELDLALAKNSSVPNVQPSKFHRQGTHTSGQDSNMPRSILKVRAGDSSVN